MADEVGQGVDGKHDDKKDHRGRIGFVDVKSLASKHVHVDRQGSSATEQAAREGSHGTRGVNECCRFADDAANCQDDATQNARHGGRQNDLDHRARRPDPRPKLLSR